jgi:hypothetical protein
MPRFGVDFRVALLVSLSFATAGCASVRIPLVHSEGRWLLNISVSDGVDGVPTFAPLILDTKLGSTVIFSSAFCAGASSSRFLPPADGCPAIALAPLPPAAVSVDVVADSSAVNARCIEAKVWASAPASAGPLATSCCITQTPGYVEFPSIAYWNSTAGSVGLAPLTLPSPAFVSPEFLDLLLKEQPTLSLDLNVAAQSWLIFGAEPPPAAERSQFLSAPAYTAPQPRSARQSVEPMQLAVFSLSLCGASLFDGATGYVAATVDTGSSCLGLPPAFYSSFLSWTTFWFRRDGMLFVREGVPLQQLPTLSFTVNNAGNSSRVFHVHLSSLVLGSRRLCVEPLFAPASFKWPPINFGALVVANFHFMYDYSLRVSALAAKTSEAPAPLSTFCAPAAHCRGVEVYDESINSCVLPYCSSRFFYKYDPSLRQCVASTTLLSLITSFLAVIVLGELLLARWQSTISARISSCC